MGGGVRDPKLKPYKERYCSYSMCELNNLCRLVCSSINSLIGIPQGCKFSDFCLISENFTSKYLKMVFEISSL